MNINKKMLKYKSMFKKVPKNTKFNFKKCPYCGYITYLDYCAICGNSKNLKD